jgi:hypothetical protein
VIAIVDRRQNNPFLAVTSARAQPSKAPGF